MFTFYVVLRSNKKLEKLLKLEISERSVLRSPVVKSGPLERALLANHFQGFRIRTTASLAYGNCRDFPHVLNVLFMEKLISRKDPVLPIEKMPSLVLTRNAR